jgi:hypothetical protein
MPLYYKKDPFLTSLLNAINNELDRLWLYRADSLKQVFVMTATDEGLRRWEKELKLIIAPDGLSIDDRRTLIIGKLMRTSNAIPYLIELTVGYITGGICHVTEDLENLKFSIDFDGSLNGIANLDRAIEAVNRMKPAHLELVVILNTHADMGGTGYPSRALTHAELGAETHERLRYIDLETLIP